MPKPVPKRQRLSKAELGILLEDRYRRFARPEFIPADPIALPHAVNDPADREIIGFWTAMLAWGQRKTILAKGRELLDLMDGRPAQFIREHREQDRKRFLGFKHRTFNATDTLWFLEFLQRHYREHDSLEDAFARHLPSEAPDVGPALIGFHRDFFADPDAPQRTRKHVATPERGSSCKRLNMFLRWMVRPSAEGVDFGLWNRIQPRQLICPLDVHVDRIARGLGLMKRNQSDWKAAMELTEMLRKFDAEDPVKFDFALFGMGVLEKKEGFEA